MSALRLPILFAALMAIPPAGAIAQDATSIATSIVIDPGAESQIQELIVGVENLDRAREVYTDVLKWRVKHAGPADLSIVNLWGLDLKAKVDEVLVGNDRSTYGFVRLVDVKGMPRRIARPNGGWFDTGGMLNLNVLVKDLDATVKGLRAHGFHGFAEPESYTWPDGATGASMMMIGHDDVVLSFQQRKSPPLSGWPPFEGASHVETGIQIVTDLDAWNGFWTTVVGLTARDVRSSAADKPIGPNDYRLPHNTVGLADSRRGGVYPRKGGEQLLGARQFLNATGTDYAERAAPPNLGIVGVRLPFSDVDDLARRAAGAGIRFAAPMQVYTLAPYGKVKGFAVRAPGGSGLWTEFFEMNPTPMTADEMKALLARDRRTTWIPVGGRGGGTSNFNKDGSAAVTWSTGSAVGRWQLKGNAICTEWTTLRDGRESCAIYYRVGEKTYQSYTMTGLPEGLNTYD